MTIPKYSIHTKQGREGYYAFFEKPWDGRQTSIKIMVAPDGPPAKDDSEAARFASLSILAYIDKCTKEPAANFTKTEILPLISEFVKDECSNLAKATIDAYRGDISRFVRSTQPIAEDITWEICRDYFAALKAEGRENKGVDNVLVNVRAFWNWLIDRRKIKLVNHPANVKKLGNYGRRDVLWDNAEYETYRNAAVPADRATMSLFWHMGIYPADYFFIRRKHIIPYEGDFVLQKLREKSTSPKAIINFPLAFSPARQLVMDAYSQTKNAEDRLFEREWSDEQYDTWNHTLNQRGRRLWERLFPDRVRKIYPDMRHTFATECANGQRFGKMIPPWQLEQWMGWVPGSAVAAKHYLSARAMPELMRLGDHQEASSNGKPTAVNSVNRQDLLPFI